MNSLQLPIDPLLPEIVQTIERNTLTLIEAEPGAGKTTRVPAALLGAGRPFVVVLEPRRIAARLAAKRVADEMGESLGETVGYQVRFERVGNKGTALWFQTEGVLVQRLLSGQELPRRSVVILDEFHERHLETDLAFALVRRLMRERTDVRLVLMSATLGAEALAGQLGEPVATVQAPGRTFAVDVRYTPASADAPELQVAAAAARALADTSGHVLAFLPGAAEIRASMRAFEPANRAGAADVFALYGELAPAEQDAAIAPSVRRKVIFATNVAESSVTIEGVTAVVDSGLARVMAYSAWSGLRRLKLGKVSRSSCIQRAGRAGRTGPGIAIRLYSAEDFHRRPQHGEPEILRADLTGTLLQLLAAGIVGTVTAGTVTADTELEWLDRPPAETLKRAWDCLQQLGAVEGNRLTAEGRRIASAPVVPRLAALVAKANQLGAGEAACRLAARLSESRVRLPEGAKGRATSDIESLLAADPSFAERKIYGQLRDWCGPKAGKADEHGLEKAILSAFGDHVARRRGQTLLLSNAGSAQLDRASAVTSEFLVAVEAEDRSDASGPLVRIASPVDPLWLLELFPDQVHESRELRWNRAEERVEQVECMRYRQLVMDEIWARPKDSPEAAEMLAQKAQETGWERWTAGDDTQRFLNRVKFAAGYTNEIPPPDELVHSSMKQMAAGLWSFRELDEAAKGGTLLNLMQASVKTKLLNDIAPAHLEMPNGRRARIDYTEGQPPSVGSRLQDFMGLRQTPTVGRGAVPLVLRLLAPNNRPVQITTDLASFWTKLYPQVRSELSRRYPRHAWPENPL